MAYINEVYCNRIADPHKLGEKVFIGIPALSKHDTLYVNGWEVKIPEDWLNDGKDIPMRPGDLPNNPK